MDLIHLQDIHSQCQIISSIPVAICLISQDGYILGVNNELLRYVNVDVSSGFRHLNEFLDVTSVRQVDVILEVLRQNECRLTMEVTVQWKPQFLRALPCWPTPWLITGYNDCEVWTFCLK